MIRWMCCFLLFVGQIQSELLNGGFERIDKTHVPIGWTPVPDSVQVVAERSNAHGGKALAHLLVEQAHQTVGLMSNSVSVQAGAFYVLTGWARVANEGHRAVVQVRWLSGDRTVIGFEQTTENTSESWAQVAGTFVAPEKAVACRVVCLAKGGEAFFDDMVLNKISGPMTFDLRFDEATLSAREKRSVSIRVAAQDSAGKHFANGAVVVFEADRGQIDPWAVVKNGAAKVVLSTERVGGIWVQAHLANISNRVYINDKKAVRLQGHMFHADTGHPLSGRVLIADSLGSVWQAGFDSGQGFVSEGMFYVDLPPGKVTVSVRRGLTELSPEPQVLDLVEGEEHTVQLPFRPWVDMKAQGWWVGGFAAEDLIARARGLDWAALPKDTHHDALQILPGEMVESRWGNQWVLGVRGQKNTRAPGFEIQAQVHRDRGIVGYAYGANHTILGLVFDVLAGPTFDALNIMSEQGTRAQDVWFALLNRGYRIAGTAFFGDFRTYTQVAGELTANRLIRAIADGQNMMTNGPLLLFSVFAAGPGSELPVGRKRRATIRAWAAADSGAYLTRIELIRNAEVIQSWDLEEQTRKHRITVALEDSVNCWYVARCYGTDSTQVALTNPIFFKTEDFAPPEPVQAVVRGVIETADSSTVPNVAVRVIDPLGKVVLETVARDGTFQVWAPATSQIQVQARGFQVAEQRIFDHKGIQDILHNTSLAMFEMDALDALAEQLQAVEMVFVLNR